MVVQEMAVHKMEVQEKEVQRTKRGDATVVGALWWQRCWCTLQRERETVQSERRLAGAAWSEARRNGGSTTLMEGFAWWWWVAGAVVERERGEMQRGAEEEGLTIFVP